MSEINLNDVTDMHIYEAIKEVIDPELFVNIVDLGLVYEVRLNKNPYIANIEMTLTSKGCPMGDAIFQDVRETLKRHFPGIEVEIDLVWEPAWSMDFVSDEGKKELSGGY